MDLNAFRRSLTFDAPPSGLDAAVLGLWWDARGHWDKAHDAAQQSEDPSASWVHAYLHRKEGDRDNAAYWYGRAGRTMPDIALRDEHAQIAAALLGGSTFQK